MLMHIPLLCRIGYLNVVLETDKMGGFVVKKAKLRLGLSNKSGGEVRGDSITL